MEGNGDILTRKILFDHQFGMHSSFWEIVNYPPEGYEFVLSNGLWDQVFDRLVTRNELILANPALVGVLNRLFPPRLLKALLDKALKRVLKQKDIDLIFSMDHPIFEKRPWVIFITLPTALTGQDVSHLRKYKSFIERQLASEHCKKIITWSKLAEASVLANFNGSLFADKMVLLPLAFHKQDFVKSYATNKVRLLFVGTANSPGGRIAAILGTKSFFDFDGKGGKEVLHAFRILTSRYPNLELVMRSGVPSAIKREFARYSNIRFIDRLIPRQELAREFMSADIFVYPTHQLTPWTVFLEAMSYELPIVTTQLYANPEIVQAGVTGLLVQPSKDVPYYWENFLPPSGSPLHQAYMEAIKSPDPAVVEDLVTKTSSLIENPQMRREMGRRARWEVEEGRHSIARRNEALRKVFDSALAAG